MNSDNILKIHIKNECTYSFLIYNNFPNGSWGDPRVSTFKKVQEAYKDTFPLFFKTMQKSLFEIGGVPQLKESHLYNARYNK